MRREAVGVVLLVGIALGTWQAWTAGMPWVHAQMNLRGYADGVPQFHRKLAIAGDSWAGYFVLRSPEFKARMEAATIDYAWHDEPDQAARMKKLAAGEYDMAAATVDSYLVNGAPVKFPAAIALVIDESKGGDALVVGPKVRNTEDLLRDDVRIAVTPASASEHLLRVVASHFQLDRLKRPGPWRVETKESKEAYDKLAKGEVEAAVLWEPDVSRAEKTGTLRRLISTRESDDVIVDVLLVARSLAASQPELVDHVARSYFQALHHYRRDPAALAAQVASDNQTDAASAKAIVDGIELVGFLDNGQEWMGVAEDGSLGIVKMAAQVQDTVAVLADSGLSGAASLAKEPMRVIDQGVLSRLAKAGFHPEGDKRTVSAEDSAKPLTDEQWGRLRPVGRLSVLPVYFKSGSNELSELDIDAMDKLARVLAKYPRFRIEIRGHSSRGSDAQADKVLSQERSDAIRIYLVQQHKVTSARIRSVGMGSSQPLARQPSEPERAWKARNQRAEFELLEEAY